MDQNKSRALDFINLMRRYCTGRADEAIGECRFSNRHNNGGAL
jgi:hypothetical protein